MHSNVCQVIGAYSSVFKNDMRSRAIEFSLIQQNRLVVATVLIIIILVIVIGCDKDFYHLNVEYFLPNNSLKRTRPRGLELFRPRLHSLLNQRWQYDHFNILGPQNLPLQSIVLKIC